MFIITSYNYLHLVVLPNSPLPQNKNKVKNPRVPLLASPLTVEKEVGSWPHFH